MPIALRHRDEPRLPIPVVPGLSVRRELDAIVMAGLQKRTVAELQDRFDAGHRAYVASMHGVPAAWGWVATRAATIGELKVAFSFSPAERYLWNFVTLPAFRGRGIYPRLLEAIVEAERVEAERFWIAYGPENHASGAGIEKAGFALVAKLSFLGDGTPVVKEIRAGGGEAASRLLGLPDTTQPIAQCWKCARGPAPAESDCSSGSCCCDYQRPETACAE
jgi:GNAT superfamily N-acetyltransferase